MAIGMVHQGVDYVWVEFLPIFLGGHNFGSRCARKAINVSKDSDDVLYSKKILSQKNGSVVWRPGPGNLS